MASIFLKTKLKKYNLISWPWQKTSQRTKTLDIAEQLDQILPLLSREQPVLTQNGDNSLFYWLKKNYLEHFRNNLPSILDNLMKLDQINQEHGIDLAVWGCSPNEGEKALVVEYLLKKGVTVVGAQHGGNVGTQQIWSDLYAEFLCTHYFSYGFDKEDYKDLYPDNYNSISCSIIPVGSYDEYEKKQSSSNRRSQFIIDILFPIHFSSSITHGGNRNKSDEFTRYQVTILETLEKLHNLNVVVKPFPKRSKMGSAVDERLKRLKHIKVFDNMGLLSCLKQYNVQAVVMEGPSTCLFETIGENLELFLMADPNMPFGNQAYSLLKKRVHCFDKLENLQEALFQYQKGQLVSLRNNEFFNRYVYRSNTPKRILTTINDLLKE